MGFFRKNPLELEIVEEEQALHYAQTDEEKAIHIAKLKELYSLNSERKKDQIHFTGDGILRSLTIVGVTVVGFLAEHFGDILPNWTKTGKW